MEVDRRGISYKGKTSKATRDLEALNKQAPNLHQSDSLTVCSLQKGAIIGEECLFPESKYFYSVTVKSSNAIFLVLNKITCKTELENPHTQLGLQLQRKFMQKK